MLATASASRGPTVIVLVVGVMASTKQGLAVRRGRAEP